MARRWRHESASMSMTWAALDEAIDEGADAGGAREDSGPILERQIRGDDRGTKQVSATEDGVEQVRRSRVARQVAELVEHDEGGMHVPAKAAFERRQGLLL
jgi:hypothetical protein